MNFSKGAKAVLTSLARNLATCSGALPTKVDGSKRDCKSPQIGLKNSVLEILSIKSLSPPCCLTTAAAWWERTLISSWTSCLEAPFSTMAMMMFSVAMNGNSPMILLSMTFGYTTKPEVMFNRVDNKMSAVKKADGKEILLMAESSKVLSNHWTEADVNVDLSGVGLTGDWVDGVEAQQFGDSLVQGFNLVVVTVEKGKEGTLSTSVLVLFGKLAQSVNDVDQLRNDHVVGVSQEDQVGVVCDETRGGTQVDDTGGFWADVTEDVDMGHDVVSDNGFFLGGSFDLLVGDFQVGGHLVNGFLRDHG
ncbi:hypothetical protein WICPIJ_009890 [Wickerhamomyces pijperi]|uniref:Uncharacterized protein n=1 Tax=Wickerhamomyces pijperi TaxID=599730 RepID=A0A9P8TBM2_WICPI|nr:hypothetical protein WICPIJ_009890 [Wickerhamomyces pijperi]